MDNDLLYSLIVKDCSFLSNYLEDTELTYQELMEYDDKYLQRMEILMAFYDLYLKYSPEIIQDYYENLSPEAYYELCDVLHYFDSSRIFDACIHLHFHFYRSKILYRLEHHSNILWTYQCIDFGQNYISTYLYNDFLREYQHCIAYGYIPSTNDFIITCQKGSFEIASFLSTHLNMEKICNKNYNLHLVFLLKNICVGNSNKNIMKLILWIIPNSEITDFLIFHLIEETTLIIDMIEAKKIWNLNFIFSMACQANNCKLILYLMSKVSKLILQINFERLCFNNYCETVQKMAEKNAMLIISITRELFIDLCYQNAYYVVVWIYDQRQFPINDIYDLLSSWCQKKRYLRLGKWLKNFNEK
jgi:hypothetical protein